VGTVEVDTDWLKRKVSGLVVGCKLLINFISRFTRNVILIHENIVTSKTIEDYARFKERTICDEWTTPLPCQVQFPATRQNRAILTTNHTTSIICDTRKW